MWSKTSLVIGVAVCVFFASMAIGGVKSPFGGASKIFAGSNSGRGGFFYFGGGK